MKLALGVLVIWIGVLLIWAGIETEMCTQQVYDAVFVASLLALLCFLAAFALLVSVRHPARQLRNGLLGSILPLAALAAYAVLIAYLTNVLNATTCDAIRVARAPVYYLDNSLEIDVSMPDRGRLDIWLAVLAVIPIAGFGVAFRRRDRD